MAHHVLVGSAAGSWETKKFDLVALKRHADLGTSPPDDLLEGRIAERFGWTFSQLDAEDYGRVLRAVQMLNMDAMYRDIEKAMRMHNFDVLTPAHWSAYKAMTDAEMEMDD